MKPHIHALGSFWLDTIIYHALHRAVAGLQWRASLLVSHCVQDLADVNRLSCIDIQCPELRLRPDDITAFIICEMVSTGPLFGGCCDLSDK